MVAEMLRFLSHLNSNCSKKKDEEVGEKNDNKKKEEKKKRKAMSKFWQYPHLALSIPI